jgi:hypothetical protein
MRGERNAAILRRYDELVALGESRPLNVISKEKEFERVPYPTIAAVVYRFRKARHG